MWPCEEWVSQSYQPDISAGRNSVLPPFPTQDTLCVFIACTKTEENARPLVVVAKHAMPAVFQRVGVAQLDLEVGRNMMADGKPKLWPWPDLETAACCIHGAKPISNTFVESYYT
jgi:hypothetical protein